MIKPGILYFYTVYLSVLDDIKISLYKNIWFSDCVCSLSNLYSARNVEYV